MLRYLNMFVLVGFALIVVSLAGFATGGKFLTEPGTPPSTTASLVYLGAGVLMLINGFVSIRFAPPSPVKQGEYRDDSAERTDEVVETTI